MKRRAAARNPGISHPPASIHIGTVASARAEPRYFSSFVQAAASRTCPVEGDSAG
jgi:hypothetical protein